MSKTTDLRLKGLRQWAQAYFPCDQSLCSPLAGDASFRRYFRAGQQNNSCILVDAPPESEKNDAFVGIAQAFEAQGIRVPKVIAADLEQGYLILSDLGDDLFSTRLNSSSVDQLYLSAMDTLLKIQQVPQQSYAFPAFDESLFMQECQLFSEWYLNKNLQCSLSAREEGVLQSTYARLIEVALMQPKTVVHRDYHSRNLLCLEDGQVGVLDFQDAVIGPLTYDLASLLKDCYVAWPYSNVVNWAQRYFEKGRQAGVIQDVTMNQFLQWFDLIAVQRHLKCIGIFSRLGLRDKKTDFLANIPRLLDYILATCSRYPQLNGLAKLLQTKVMKHESYDIGSGARKSSAAVDG